MNRNRKYTNKIATTALSLALAGNMIFMMPASAYAATATGTNTGSNTDAANTAKEENVYATLNEDGSVKGIYVVNAYDLSQDTQIVDYGTYTSLRNLTSDQEIHETQTSDTAGEEEFDQITVDAKKGKFYYQGNLDTKDLPWKIAIIYTLDGKEVTAEDLAGKSGTLQIHMEITQNSNVDASFFENYLLQATLSLPTEHCGNITAEGATIGNVGSNKQVLYNIMGGNEKTYDITADVTDFEMDAITFKGVPMSFDINTDDMDTSALTEKTQELTDGVNQLNEGAQSLAAGVSTLSDGTSAYTDGVDRLASGSSTLSSQTTTLPAQLNTLTQAVEELSTGSQKLSDTNRGAAAQITAALNNLEDGLNQTKTGMQTYAGVLDQVQKEYQDEADTLGKIIKGVTSESTAQSTDGTTDRSSEESTQTTTGEPTTTTTSETQTGEYQKDRTETSQEETTDEEGNKIVTITNHIYLTRENTTTITKETQTNTETTVTQKETVTKSGETVDVQSVDADTLKALGALQYRMNVNAGNLAELETKVTGEGGMIDGVDQLLAGVEALKGAVSGESPSSLQSNLDALTKGMTTLQAGSSTLPGISTKLTTAIDTLDTGLQTLNGKSSTLNTGVSKLSLGADTLSDGTQTLSDKTSGIDDQILDGIETELENFTGQNYDGISFISKENTNVDAVQFAMQTAEVKVEEQEPEKKVKKEQTVWDKIKNLF